MNRSLKYGLVLLLVALVGYKSVYFRKLSSMKAAGTGQFNAMEVAQQIWTGKLPARLTAAIDLTALIDSIKANPEQAFASHSNAIAIGNYRYSLVHLTGEVTDTTADDVQLRVKSGDSTLLVNIATEYIYGNAIRDASGLVDIRNFSGNADLSNISEALNKKVRAEVVPELKKNARKGQRLEITGATELNKEHISFHDLEIIPLRCKVIH